VKVVLTVVRFGSVFTFWRSSTNWCKVKKKKERKIKWGTG